MTLSKRRMLHNYNLNNRILRKEMKVPVYQIESDPSDFGVRILGGLAIVFMALALLAALTGTIVSLYLQGL